MVVEQKFLGIHHFSFSPLYIISIHKKQGYFAIVLQNVVYSYSLHMIFRDGEGIVKNYHIRKDKDTKMFYFAPQHSFKSIAELINYHKFNRGGTVLILFRIFSLLAYLQARLIYIHMKSFIVSTRTIKYATAYFLFLLL